MGMSYGVAICLPGRFKQAALEPHVREGLAALAEVGVKLDVEHGRKHTLLVQGDGDHAQLWENEQAFFALAGSLAKALGCRAWAISGFAGTANSLVIQSFAADGTRAWSTRQRPALRRFKEEAGFADDPFDLFIKPFLERDPGQWKRVGNIEVSARVELTLVEGKALAAAFGRPLPGAKGWVVRQPFAEGVEVQHLFLQLAPPKLTLEKLGLWEVGFSPPDFSPQQREELIKLPDGSSVRGYFNSVRGLVSERRGKQVTLRWGFTVHGSKEWLQVSVLEGPWQADLAQLQREEQQARAERDADHALDRDDVKGLLRAMREGKLELETWTERARLGARWKCFEALLQRLPAKRQQAERNALLDELPWRKALALGADLNAPVNDWSSERLLHTVEELKEAKALLKAGASLTSLDSDRRTPLHRAQNPAIAKLFLAAGAPLHLKDKQGYTPLESYVRSLSFATPAEEDLEVVAAMVKVGAQPSGKGLQKLLAPWKAKKTHLAAWQQLSLMAR